MKAHQDFKTHDGFLGDPDDLEYEIHCVECKKPIWQTKILKRSGAQVVSTETKRVGHDIEFSRHIDWCPLCGKRFHAYGVQGFQLYLIKCLRSGIRRLI